MVKTEAKSDQSQPQTTRIFALFGLFASAVAYALALSTKQGTRWAQEQTWSTVVLGVMLTSGWLAVEDREAAEKNFVYFFVAGIPMIVRSLWIQLQQIDAVYKRGQGQ